MVKPNPMSESDVRIVDPRTGEALTVRLTYAAVLTGLHPLTYLPELAVTLPSQALEIAQILAQLFTLFMIAGRVGVA